MNIGIELFTESQKHHSYFNRKVYIDWDGNIRNSPETSDSFGNLLALENIQVFVDIVESKEFQNLWKVTKDICDVCKDCELRYMCVDNRLPIRRKENEWYHLKECDYNPYINKWKGEIGYHSLMEIGVLSNANGFSINHELINTVNNKLWGES
jgi:radical SAM protein with 4Fe4S-binding SPASM domain